MWPFCGSVDWWRRYLEGRLAGEESLPPMPRRELMRCHIRDHAGNELTLSVPVAGGASVVKHAPVENWIISEHGRWEAMHLGALNAAYGKTPFYRHYIPRLQALIEHHPERATDFTNSIGEYIAEALHIETLLPQLRENDATRREMIAERRERLDRNLPPSTSILDPLFRFGPEAIFLLIPAL